MMVGCLFPKSFGGVQFAVVDKVWRGQDNRRKEGNRELMIKYRKSAFFFIYLGTRGFDRLAMYR